jgi:hypothetical protein
MAFEASHPRRTAVQTLVTGFVAGVLAAVATARWVRLARMRSEAKRW